ncbi:MAG: copper amine oxidase N-terminal domain-containing protein [Clostridiales bacterium]|nr:copper amine oxidase N-terminal domain-containing protein [Clostridiales bacterium]
MKGLKFIISASLAMLCISASASAELVPMRSALEERGMSVEWQSRDKITVKKDGCYLYFAIDSDTLQADEGEFKMQQPAKLIDGVTYISPEAPELAGDLVLYHKAIIDAMQADEDERLPLRAIDTNADKVLVCTWNRYPDSYVTGSDITIKYGDVWVFKADEIMEWGHKNGMAKNMTRRMEQLIGLYPNKGYTHFSMLWVNPKDLYRPSPDNEVTDNIASLIFSEGTDESYIEWFNSNIISSYYPHKYPWTRLGYTYDWADNGTDYGLSEFVLRNGSEAKVEKTMTNEEFYKYITE